MKTILHEDEYGYVIAEGNELTIGSKVDDPPKVRITSKITQNGAGGGCISFNASRSYSVCFGSDQDEMAIDRVEQAQDVRGQTGNLKAERNFMVNDGSGSHDGAMQKPFAFVWNALTRLRLNFGTYYPDTMWAPNGLTFTQQQSDGNFVTYTVERPFDKGANPIPVWSAWTGKI